MHFTFVNQRCKLIYFCSKSNGEASLKNEVQETNKDGYAGESKLSAKNLLRSLLVIDIMRQFFEFDSNFFHA